MGTADVDLIRRKYDFQWEVLDVIIGGKSLIDTNRGLTGFPMFTAVDADRFVRSYGFSLDDPIETAELLGNFHEAINFIRKFFLYPENPDGLKLEIPRKILELSEVRDLLLMASMRFPGQMQDTQGNLLKHWACTLLKVIHAIVHLDKDFAVHYSAEIQKQILDPFYKLIHRNEAGRLFLGTGPDDPVRVDLVAFETKAKKARDSTLLKLLHKPENVAEEIFDRVGIRFVTATPLDGLRVVRYLKDAMMIMPANIKPSRSRNTLVNVDALRERLSPLLERVERNGLTEEGLRRELEAVINPAPADKGANPHTSEAYRAIQFTARQLIKLRNPHYEDLKELKNLAKTASIPEETLATIKRIDLKFFQREIRFFYPYELQIMDERSAEENERGASAHTEYKKSQLASALSRVMGNLIDAVRQ